MRFVWETLTIRLFAHGKTFVENIRTMSTQTVLKYSRSEQTEKVIVERKIGQIVKRQQCEHCCLFTYEKCENADALVERVAFTAEAFELHVETKR